MGDIRVFRHSFHIDTETESVTESGDPIQTSDAAKKIYREIFVQLKNEVDWKTQTQRIVVRSWTEAQLVSEALTYFLGGAEVEMDAKGNYKVGSKGYYHYITNQRAVISLKRLNIKKQQKKDSENETEI